MANASIQKQVDTTIKVLVTLIAVPRVSAAALAKLTGQTPGAIARLISRLRDAGLRIDYDFSKETYKVDLSEVMQKSLLNRYAKKLRTLVGNDIEARARVKFVSALDRYTLPQWAEAYGTTSQNVYNMIIGYKGAQLPAGWVAYQMNDRGKWLIQKMDKDRTGKKWVLPDTAKDAYRITIGEGEDADRATQIRRMKCSVHDCPESIFSKGLCTSHYYMHRRNAAKFATLKLDRAVGD